MRSRRFTAAVFAVATLVGLAACGADETTSATPLERVRGSAEKVIDAGSSRMAMSVESSGAAAFNFKGEGAYDYAARRGEITMDTSSLAAAALPQELKVIVDGGTIYMSFGSMLPLDKEWAKIDLDRIDELAPQFRSLAQLGSNNDPRAFLAYSAGVEDVKRVGSEKIRGDDTTHYTATVDLEAAADAVDDPDLAEPIETAIETLGTSTMPGEFWVDAKGRLRRYRSEIDLSKVQAPGGVSRQTGTVTTVVEFFDFGTDVKVEAPPDDEVADLIDLMKDLS